jgi:hypothetical protein
VLGAARTRRVSAGSRRGMFVVLGVPSRRISSPHDSGPMPSG